MSRKYIGFICYSMIFVHSASSQMRVPGFGSIRGDWANGIGYGGWKSRAGCAGRSPDIAAAGALGASNGGSLAVVSSSSTAPTGLSVTSENYYEGNVAINGNLPFLGTADVEGTFSSSGFGGINYSCGDGAVGITDESPVGPIAPTATAPIATTKPGFGYRGFSGYAGTGCGCGGALY
ncbi:chorion class B protein ERB4-like [Bombyx mori]|uniref:Chorion early B n=1 Tax=Bombyx mori TaxID=7091 RepID=A0A0K2S3Q5_BOMMO|nr:chorion class B protein ERB4-like [Bombyx mori]BAS21480.1 chorion early B [Bombyx mori]